MCLRRPSKTLESHFWFLQKPKVTFKASQRPFEGVPRPSEASPASERSQDTIGAQLWFRLDGAGEALEGVFLGSLRCHLTTSQDSGFTYVGQLWKFPSICSKPMWLIPNSQMKKSKYPYYMGGGGSLEIRTSTWDLHPHVCYIHRKC